MSDYLTPTVQGIIQHIRQGQDYSPLPILADALQDADYPDEDTLKKLREDAPDVIEAQLVLCKLLGGEYQDSVAWMVRFAAELGDSHGYEGERNQPMNYRVLMEAAHDHFTSGDYLIQWGHDNWRDTFYGNQEKFWGHYEIITGRVIEDKEVSFISCSC